MGVVLVGAEEEVPPVEGGQEVVRVSADQRQVEVERGEQLGRHQAEQVRPRGGAQARRLPEGRLGPTRPADHRGPLEDLHREAGPGEQGGRDQAVVAGPDHDDVTHHIAVWVVARHWGEV